MRVCDICGTLNFKENNYCTHCGNNLVLDHVCPFCGKVNPDNVAYCISCERQINPVKIDDFDTLFSEYNEKLLNEATIADDDYLEILSNIFIRAQYIKYWGESPKKKIISLANVYTECIPKSRGFERGYIFNANRIYYEDRLDESVQIATIIHELAHYFLFAIVEELLCSIFNVRTSSTIQSFVWYFLTLPEFKIMNEYCAHTVEGRFIPFGYQNYGTFNMLVQESGMDEEFLKTSVKIGNTFANEIIVFLEKYIDEDLRNEIKIQYRKDMNPPNNESIFMETDDSFPLKTKNYLLLRLLCDVFGEVLRNIEEREELEKIRNRIELR